MTLTALGNYRLLAELGRGGNSDVYLAVRAGLAPRPLTLVVIKTPRDHLADDPEILAMLVDEALIAARLSHPNVVQTIEVGEADGKYFLAMEYLDGQPLHRVLGRHRDSFPLEMHLSVLSDALGGLHHAHELRDRDGSLMDIVHRDVNPHNIFITYEGQVKVIDFGIAKAVRRAAETRAGVIKGKIVYMAPEQAMGEGVDRRTDIFAVGVMLYEAIARRRMWHGVGDKDVLSSLCNNAIPSDARVLVADAPEQLVHMCARALAFAPNDRYATAAEFQGDIDEFLSASAPRPTKRELGDFLAERFKEKRAATWRVIEAQHASPDSTNAPSPLSQTSTQSLRSSPGIMQEAGSDRFAAALEESVPLRRFETGKRRWRLPGALAAGVLALLVAARVGVTPRVVIPPSVGAAPIPVEIRLTLRCSPPEALFRLDDGPLVPTPFDGRFPRDDREHSISLEAPGYLPKTARITLREDTSLRVSLARAADSPPPH